MQAFLITALLTFTNLASAATICLESADTTKTPFENDILTIKMVDANSNRLLSVKTKVSATDSAPFGNVIKTYSQEDGGVVAEIRYASGVASKLVANEGNTELPLTLNESQTTAQGAACFDIGK